MVDITRAKKKARPLYCRKENENAARAHEIICPKVIRPATRNEFMIKRPSGIFDRALLKLLIVGCFGNRLSSVVNRSPDGIRATLTA